MNSKAKKYLKVAMKAPTTELQINWIKEALSAIRSKRSRKPRK